MTARAGADRRVLGAAITVSTLGVTCGVDWLTLEADAPSVVPGRWRWRNCERIQACAMPHAGLFNKRSHRNQLTSGGATGACSDCRPGDWFAVACNLLGLANPGPQGLALSLRHKPGPLRCCGQIWRFALTRPERVRGGNAGEQFTFRQCAAGGLRRYGQRNSKFLSSRK